MCRKNELINFDDGTDADDVDADSNNYCTRRPVLLGPDLPRT